MNRTTSQPNQAHQERTFQGTIVSCDIRTPKEKTRTILQYNQLAGKRVPTEVTLQGQDYAVLKVRSQRTGQVHRCVAWKVEDLSRRPIRWANPGDQVQIIGTPEVVQITRDDGTTFDLFQIVITGYTVLSKQPRKQPRHQDRRAA